MPMFVLYDGRLFTSAHVDNQYYIVTRDRSKIDELFHERRECFARPISLDDAKLTDIYDIRFWAEFFDEVEPQSEWDVTPGCALHRPPDITKDEIGLWVGHNQTGSGWTVFSQSESSKIVLLSDCTRLMIEKIYMKKSGHYVDSVLFDKKQVFPALFKSEMLRHVRMNI